MTIAACAAIITAYKAADPDSKYLYVSRALYYDKDIPNYHFLEKMWYYRNSNYTGLVTTSQKEHDSILVWKDECDRGWNMDSDSRMRRIASYYDNYHEKTPGTVRTIWHTEPCNSVCVRLYCDFPVGAVRTYIFTGFTQILYLFWSIYASAYSLF